MGGFATISPHIKQVKSKDQDITHAARVLSRERAKGERGASPEKRDADVESFYERQVASLEAKVRSGVVAPSVSAVGAGMAD